jgi:uncharacterized protein (TIGR03435 family)
MRLIVCLTPLILSPTWILAQSDTLGPSFEVASVKPSPADARFDMRPEPGGRFTARSITIKLLITVAYDAQDYQLSGGPGWIDSEKYDVVALAGHDVSRDELRMLLRTLLADRFKLKLRQEPREMSVYSLVVGKNGPKLEEVDPQTQRAGVRSSSTRMIAAPATMAQLATALGISLRCPVLDNTGLKGKYNFKLEWSAMSKPARPPGDDSDLVASDPSGPSIFTALQEQLGLRLRSQKGSGTFFVIERVERPSEN